ncbi:sugar kinase [Pseudaminobacter arsenicus]|uniref:Sugar kinase n=1 Tax=Borborobacter arsenicus TaxID=1851146 RepID=A0A432V7Z7_9HYPH|nr:sugar kinase [Pseudaminobacter arsenicus]RUM98193.1 sugar kinase [Pseudaminobacter arsenicus]
MTKRFLSIGEAMIEMSAASDNWRMGYAGDTMNTAWYARAFLDASWSVSYFTALGIDRYSQGLKRFIADAGIDTGSIATVADRRPGLYFIHQENGDRQFTYWRDMSAAKLLARDEAALQAALDGADEIYFSGITLAILDQSDRERFLTAIGRRRRQGARISFDPNIRPRLWSGNDEIRDWLTRAGRVCDIVLPTFGDEQALFGDEDVHTTAARYARLGAHEVVVKNGHEPALVPADGNAVEVPAIRVETVVDATGAGDSFNGAYLAARLNGAAGSEAAALAHRVAAICIGHHGALAPREALLNG